MESKRQFLFSAKPLPELFSISVTPFVRLTVQNNYDELSPIDRKQACQAWPSCICGSCLYA